MRTGNDIENEIRTAGGDILDSEMFARGFGQSHHFRSNVSDHSLHVTKTALRMAGLFRSVDREALIKACLCHDMGLIGNRKYVYTTGRMCITQHPIDSAQRAESIIGTLNDTEKDVILHHMYPLVLKAPRTKEGVLICIADKCCALYEPFTIRSSSDRLHERLHISVKKMA
jgi:uncharacterized protein